MNYDTTYRYKIELFGFDTLYAYYTLPIDIDTMYKYDVSYIEYDSITVYDTLYRYDVHALTPNQATALVEYETYTITSTTTYGSPYYTVLAGEGTDYPASPYPYTFEVVAFNDRGCVATSAPFTVNVQEPIVVNVSISGAEVCPGTEITVTAEVDNWDLDNLTFVWSDGIHTGPSFTTTIFNDTSYSVQVTHISGCTAVSEVANVTVRAIEPIVATATVTADTVCNGATITLTGTATGTGVLTYQWYANGVAIPGATHLTSTHVAEAIDGTPTTYQYSLVVTSAGDSYCDNAGASTETVIADNTVTVYPDPVVIITGDNVICENGNIVLTPTVQGGTGTTTYTWYLNNTEVSGPNVSVDPVTGVLTVPMFQIQLMNLTEYTLIQFKLLKAQDVQQYPTI